MKKNKLIFALCGIALVIVMAFPISKYYLSNAVSENVTSGTQVTEPSLTASGTSEVITQIITEILTTEKHTSKPETTTDKITELQTESETVTKEINTKKETKPILPTVPDIQFELPTLKFPDLKPTTTSSASENQKNDLSCFDNTVFLGNSRFISFKNYGLAKNVYSVVGLNVDTVFTKSVSGSSIPVINELNGKKYEKVVLLFGDNECGWPNQNVFINRYAKVVAAVRERIPNAEIYLHAILPVSSEVSAKSEFGCNNQTINSLNEKIKQLAADEGVNYIEQPPCLKDTDGALLPQAASDGIHLNKKYSVIWLEYLSKTII